MLTSSTASSTRQRERALEEEMNLEKYEFQSEFLRSRLAQGRDEGREEGRVEGLARAVITVLEARRLSVSDEQRGMILGCTEPEVLEAWLQRAATADGAGDLFGP
jgi:hypothetical protein